MTNHEIAKLLDNIAASYTIKNENKYRFQIIAYQKASDTIENLNTEIRDLYKENKLEQLPGIGKSIQAHLIELMKTGKVKHFEWVLKDIPESVFILLEVPTFGPKKSYRLVKKFSLNNPNNVVDKLLNIAKAGKIANLEGFGEKSEQDIIRAIEEYKMGKSKTKRMILPFAFEIAQKIVNYLKKSKFIVEAYPLGSLRRMVPTVGDIDIAISTNNPNEAIKHFIAYPYQERVIEKGETTASIFLSGGQQVDLMTQTPDGFGSLLQHFTGSKNHNIRLREYALQKGLSLSEYGIKKKIDGKEKLFKYNAEEKFYNALGMDWIAPEIREDTGEIELAIKNKLPKLVELSDIKGDLHIHSNYSIEPNHDLGQNSMQEMLEKAKKLNYEYLGFSEHNPSINKHTQNDIYNILTKRNKYIEQIKSRNKNVRVINLLEVDILVDGNLAINDKCASLLDAMIIAIHTSFAIDKEKMTERIIRGLSHPKAKILAHPTGRLLNERTGYELDWEKIFDFCKKNNKALEINAWPKRLDLPDTIVRKAIEKNIKMVINTDSHELSTMDGMKFGVAVARRGWASKNDILNTLSYNKFIEWLKK